jgi:hypothetical protein
MRRLEEFMNRPADEVKRMDEAARQAQRVMKDAGVGEGSGHVWDRALAESVSSDLDEAARQREDLISEVRRDLDFA